MPLTNRTLLLGGVLLALVLGGAGVASVGLGPLASDAPADDSAVPDDQPAADDGAAGDDSDESSDDGANDGPGDDASVPDEGQGELAEDLSFDLVGVEECGSTCRDVTTTLHNEGDEPVHDVSVLSRIYAGENNTDDDDLVWESTQNHGTIAGNGSETTTERVELSLAEAMAIERADGWITVETVVESDSSTTTFQEVRQAD